VLKQEMSTQACRSPTNQVNGPSNAQEEPQIGLRHKQ